MVHLREEHQDRVRRSHAHIRSWSSERSYGVRSRSISPGPKTVAVGNGRVSIWLHPRSAVIYKYTGSHVPTMNLTWIDAFVYTANRAEGLYVISNHYLASQRPERHTIQAGD